jgi:hypothetical protein
MNGRTGSILPGAGLVGAGARAVGAGSRPLGAGSRPPLAMCVLPVRVRALISLAGTSPARRRPVGPARAREPWPILRRPGLPASALPGEGLIVPTTAARQLIAMQPKAPAIARAIARGLTAGPVGGRRRPGLARLRRRSGLGGGELRVSGLRVGGLGGGELPRPGFRRRGCCGARRPAACRLRA